MPDDRDLVAWKDKDGVTHVDHPQPQPDPIPRAHTTLAGILNTFERLGLMPPREPEHTPDYFITQARYFHKVAADSYTADAGTDPLLTNLLIAVDYLIELEEARAEHHWIH